MDTQRRELYASSNGDRWFLVREGDSGRVLVLHLPNAASGGRTSQIEIGAFLNRDARGPEHQALMRLIGTLVEASSDAPRSSPHDPSARPGEKREAEIPNQDIAGD